jgi:hypothetical protein
MKDIFAEMQEQRREEVNAPNPVGDIRAFIDSNSCCTQGLDFFYVSLVTFLRLP